MTRDRTSDRQRARSGDHLGVQVGLRAESRAQLEQWRTAAKRDGRPLAQWIRRVLDAMAGEKP